MHARNTFHLTREEGFTHQKIDGEFPERWADQIFKTSLPKNEFPVAS